MAFLPSEALRPKPWAALTSLPLRPTVHPPSNRLGSAFDRGPESDSPTRTPHRQVPDTALRLFVAAAGPTPRSFPAPSVPPTPGPPSLPHTGPLTLDWGTLPPASSALRTPITAPQRAAASSGYFPSLRWGTCPGSARLPAGPADSRAPSTGTWLRDVRERVSPEQTLQPQALLSSLAAVSPSEKWALTPPLPQPRPGPRAL